MNTTSTNKIITNDLPVKYVPQGECIKNAVMVIETQGEEPTPAKISKLTGISYVSCARYYRLIKHSRKRYRPAKQVPCPRDPDHINWSPADCHVCINQGGCIHH